MSTEECAWAYPEVLNGFDDETLVELAIAMRLADAETLAGMDSMDLLSLFDGKKDEEVLEYIDDGTNEDEEESMRENLFVLGNMAILSLKYVQSVHMEENPSSFGKKDAYRVCALMHNGERLLFCTGNKKEAQLQFEAVSNAFSNGGYEAMTTRQNKGLKP